MCLFPRTIGGKNRYYLPDSSSKISARTRYFYNQVTVPCGHCSQCLKKRQNDLAARCAIEAEKRGSMVFVTLTYRDDALPLAMHLEVADTDTGEIEYKKMSPGSFVDYVEQGSELDAYARDALSKLDRTKCRYVYSDLVSLSSDDVLSNSPVSYRYCITPSLRRRDVQLWLKSCRVQYEREFGLKLAPFSYVACGEYGSVTHRPHYHVAFFGLSKVVVDWMCSRWQRQFGFSYVQQVNCVNADGSSGFIAASKYIGKYMSKGQFECESVKNKCALKPRLMCSKGVGNESKEKVLSDNLVSYYRGYDLVGEYDIHTCLRSDGSRLKSKDYDLLARELGKRLQFTVHHQYFPIPHRILLFLWYEKNYKGSYVASPVRKEITFRLRSNPVDDYLRQFRQSAACLSQREAVAFLSAKLKDYEFSLQFTDACGFDALQKFYSKSKF